MWNAIIALGATITIFVITFVVGGYAMTPVLHATGQIVQNSGNAQLQATYSATEPVVTNASDGYDIWHFIRAIGLLVGLPVSGYIGIKFIQSL